MKLLLISLAVFGSSVMGLSLKQPSAIISSTQASDICKGFTFLQTVSDDASECSKECAREYYSADPTKKYDYEMFMTCYRCCYSGAECIAPVPNAVACSGKGNCVQVQGKVAGEKTKSSCSCDKEYRGEFCERKKSECPMWGLERLVCNNRGACNAETATCACAAGWQGEACQYRVCPKAPGDLRECSGLTCNTATGACICGDKWKGEACNVKACPRDANDHECSNVGTCTPEGVCQCNASYKGEACHLPKCPANNAGVECGGPAHGSCDILGKCNCRPGSKGPACSDKECPFFLNKECGGRGQCVNGECKCELGEWKGTKCEIKACPFNPENKLECNAKGVCDDQGVCKCVPSHKGPSCSALVCPKDAHGNECSNGNGTCEPNGQCTCKPGWKGPACDLKVCPIDLGNSPLECGGPEAGTCNGETGQCVCSALRKGGACQIPRCPGQPTECSGNGDCSNGTCFCLASHKGPACAALSCPKAGGIECNLQGVCKADGTCGCNAGWRGAMCQQKICGFSPKNNRECFGKGTCLDSGECSCAPGYRGPLCEDKICPFVNGLECNGKGTCNSLGVCSCVPTYRGATCETYYEAKTAIAYFEGPRPSGGVVPIAARAELKVVEGELFEGLVTCNLGHYVGGALVPGTVSLQAVAEGLLEPVGAGANTAVTSLVSTVSPATSLGLFRAKGTGAASLTGKYWAKRPDAAASATECTLSAVRINSGRATASEAVLPNEDGRAKFSALVSVLTDDVSATITAKAGENILVRAACSLWTLGGATVYLRAVNSAGSAVEVAPSNWITVTSRLSGATGGWSNGISQAVYRATTNGPATFKGSTHCGSQFGAYGSCTIVASILNDTFAGGNSNGARDWQDRFVNVADLPKPMDWSTTIQVEKNDEVRAFLSCNILSEEATPADRFEFWRIAKIGGVEVEVTQRAGAARTLSSQQWIPGTSTIIVEAQQAGDLTFAGEYYFTTGGPPITFTYCNVIAQNLGRKTD